MLNLCWSNTKRFLSVLYVFGKNFVFVKIVKIFKSCVALFWRLSHGLIQSHAPVVSPHRDFSWLTGESMSQLRKILGIFFKIWFFMFLAAQYSDLFAGGRSSREGYTDFCGLPRDFLAGRPSSHKKHLENFSKFLFLSVLAAGPSDLHGTWFSCENRVFCTNWLVFKTFGFFPQNFVTVHCFPRLNPF